MLTTIGTPDSSRDQRVDRLLEDLRRRVGDDGLRTDDLYDDAGTYR